MPRFLILIFVVLSSCNAVWQGSLSSSLAIPPEKYFPIKRVSGYSHSFIFLGIGGMGHYNMVEEARRNLILNNPLDSGQVFGNWSVSINSNSLFFIIQSQTFLVEADIISLTPTKPESLMFISSNKSVQVRQPTEDEIGIGKVIYFDLNGKLTTGEIKSINGQSVKIKYGYPSGILGRTKTISVWRKDLKMVKE